MKLPPETSLPRLRQVKGGVVSIRLKIYHATGRYENISKRPIYVVCANRDIRQDISPIIAPSLAWPQRKMMMMIMLFSNIWLMVAGAPLISGAWSHSPSLPLLLIWACMEGVFKLPCRWYLRLFECNENSSSQSFPKKLSEISFNIQKLLKLPCHYC